MPGEDSSVGDRFRCLSGGSTSWAERTHLAGSRGLAQPVRDSSAVAFSMSSAGISAVSLPGSASPKSLSVHAWQTIVSRSSAAEMSPQCDVNA